MHVKVKSRAFSDGEMIPRQYTCNGDGISPPISWESPSDNIQSFALICDDPDAPIGTFTHWVIYDLPPDLREIPERIPNESTVPGGGIHGINSLHKTGYTSPCPPSGTHHYHFKVYALDTKLNLNPGASKDKVLKAMQGHIKGEGELIGLYQHQ